MTDAGVVLVVDDLDANRRLLDAVLAPRGYRVVPAASGEEALELLKGELPDASGQQEKVMATEAGADDFVTKPFDQAELLARVRSLVRVNRYHQTVTDQARQLAEWNEQQGDLETAD